jgi:heptosyltransferase II
VTEGRQVNYLKERDNSLGQGKAPATAASPILIVPYMWIGDFERCHSVVRLLNTRFPDRPVDVLITAMVAPLLDYTACKGIVFDLPRKRLALSAHRALAARLRAESYGNALIMPRTWKSALAPALAGIPVRTGFVGEMRFGLINDLRRGEKALPRMVDRCAALALPKHAALPPDWPHPQLVVPREGCFSIISPSSRVAHPLVEVLLLLM